MKTPVSRVKLGRAKSRRSSGGAPRRASPSKLCEKTDSLNIKGDTPSKASQTENSIKQFVFAFDYQE